MDKFLADIFDKHGLSYKFNGQKTWMILEECPFCLSRGHSHNDKFKLYISLSSPFYYCHRCKAQGYLMYLFQTLGLDNEWIKFIVSSTNSLDSVYIRQEYDEEEIDDASKLTKSDFEEFRIKYERRNHLYQLAKDYLVERGFKWEFVRDKFVFMTKKYYGDEFSRRYFGRFLIPDVTYTGFTARDFVNVWNPDYTLRYLSSEAAGVFGGIVNEENKDIYVVEGPLDAIKNLQLGFNSFGVGGKSKALKFFKNNKQLLSKFNIVYIVEGDVSFGEASLKETFTYLSKNYKNVYYIDLKDTPFKDTAEIEKIDEFLQLEKKPISHAGHVMGELNRILNAFQ